MRVLFGILSLSIALVNQSNEVAAFSSRSSGSFRPRSSLSMNVEVNGAAKVIKVGVIGMGRIGLVHLEAITKAPGVIPVIVSNPTISKAEAGEYLLFSLLSCFVALRRSKISFSVFISSYSCMKMFRSLFIGPSTI